ncbi:putative choline transporter, neither null mutation nor overexpression affects choline transport [Podochytrium sp. JEL0797]|nr:putative choline transporter, neither null mutation nor overexpression affects choline transport [Podochytrium sp. JEL0797]
MSKNNYYQQQGQSQDPLIQQGYHQGQQQGQYQTSPYGYAQQQQQYAQPQQSYAPPQQPYTPQYAPQYSAPDNSGKNPVPPSNPPQFVDKPKYNDLWATILFVVVMACFVVMAAVGLPYAKSSFETGVFTLPNGQTSTTTTAKNNGPSSTSTTANLGLRTSDIGYLVAASVGAGLAFSITYFFLMMSFAGPMITFSYFVNVCLLLALAAYSFYSGIWIMGIIYIIFAGLTAMSYYWCRSRIPFSKLVLETVCKITKRFNGTLFVALGAVLVSAAYQVLWIMTLLGMSEFAAQKNLSNGIMICIMVLLVFINFWFNEVVRNTAHVAICGTFASYFFLGMEQPNSDAVTLPSNHTTAKSLGRALTTSFGSICFGSLLISLIRTLRFLAQMARNDAAQDGNILCCILATCMECILGCLQGMLDFFNKYAYTEIAIYGKSYCDAGRDTWNLIQYKGIDLIINDCMIGMVLGMGSLFCALFCAFMGFLVVNFNGFGTVGATTGSYLGVCFGCAFIGGWLFLVLMEVVDSGQSATFVCLAEDPATIQRRLPTLFAMVQDRFPQITWGMQSVAN